MKASALLFNPPAIARGPRSPHRSAPILIRVPALDPLPSKKWGPSPQRHHFPSEGVRLRPRRRLRREIRSLVAVGLLGLGLLLGLLIAQFTKPSTRPKSIEKAKRPTHDFETPGESSTVTVPEVPKIDLSAPVPIELGRGGSLETDGSDASLSVKFSDRLLPPDDEDRTDAGP